VRSRSLPARVWRALRLDWHLYEEVEHDRTSIGQACLVVLVACAAGAFGTWMRDVVIDGHDPAESHVRIALALDLVEPLVFWLGGSFFAYMVGVSVFRGPHTHSDYREVLRTTGFAFAPGVLRGLAFVPPPPLGFGLTVAGDAWMMVCGIVAVRQALDFTTGRAIGTFGLAYALLWLALQGILGTG
jgi:hypothetical protein